MLAEGIVESGNSIPEKKRDPTEDFQLLEKLGQGSYGSVYKAKHIKTGTITAIKKIRIEEELDSMLKEIKTLKECKNQYIIKYFGSYLKEDELWIVMEYFSGGSVGDIMKILEKNLTERQIAIILSDALKGLQFLHALKKIHRDIKAANILVNSQGEPKLADFGVAGQLSDAVTKRQTIIGTPYWMAPEVIQETGHDTKADIWSLGITVWLSVLETDFNSLSRWHKAYNMYLFLIPNKPPATLLEPDKWSDNCKDFLALCLQKNPDDRPSAEELLKHPFVQSGDGYDMIATLIKEVEKVIEQKGRAQALKLHLTAESDLSSLDFGSNVVQQGNSKSKILSSSMTDTGTTTVRADTGTVVIHEDSGTVVRHESVDLSNIQPL